MPQDFHRQNLQGYSFKGQDLTDANFSHCEIQGVDFTNAILIRANFSKAQTGIPSGWITGLAIISFILAITSGLVTLTFGGGMVGMIFTFGELPITFFTVVMLATFTVFVIFINSRGLGAAIWALIAALPVSMVLLLVMSLVGGLSGFVPGKSVTVVAIAFVGGIAGAIAAVMCLTGAIFLATSVTIAGVACRSAAIIVAVAGAISMLLVTVGTVPMAMAQSGGNLFSTDGLIAVNKIMAEFVNDKITATETWAKIFALAGAGVGTATVLAMIAVTLPALILGSYIAWRALAGDVHYNFILRVAVNLASKRGTNFSGLI
ncbi:pentapeptide repeat-containing protein [Argonema antarcticum]|uniref:pentapeptide repeat-containing protein n=1 Tax=Argonema antarcticum TaxID=2942763 RepID=UPI002012886E|nr:pentapeptide repeat-containing protein [Argonema antarcticum]MCL1475978.1 pentapeptide repeat-containing protein [Argonema antarcticum A004/B2]